MVTPFKGSLIYRYYYVKASKASQFVCIHCAHGALETCGLAQFNSEPAPALSSGRWKIKSDSAISMVSKPVVTALRASIDEVEIVLGFA
jgi:hypothetical protein